MGLQATTTKKKKQEDLLDLLDLITALVKICGSNANEVIDRFAVRVSDYILCIAWVKRDL